MRNFLALGCLVLTMTAGVYTSAAQAASPVQDVLVYAPATDFKSLQQLALQNRQERFANLQNAANCIQQARTNDGIYKCVAAERLELDRIRLTYCKTDFSWERNKTKKQRQSVDEYDTGIPEECQKAVAAFQHDQDNILRHNDQQ